MSGAHLFASGGPYKSGGTLAAHDTTSFDFFSFFFAMFRTFHGGSFRFFFGPADRLRPRRRKEIFRSIHLASLQRRRPFNLATSIGDSI